MTLNHRYEFMYLFDVKDGNPNGDPDAGNLPRIDSETGHGLISDVCLKRKIRNYVSIAKQETTSYDIYVKEKAILNDQHELAYKALGHDMIDEKVESTTEEKSKKKKDPSILENSRKKWMCQNFYDIRAFGAVMSTGEDDKKCGQVRGPVQLTFARSIDPIVPVEHTITRMAVATQKEAEKQKQDNKTMGRKHTVPYALYRTHGFISAHLAQKTEFSERDLELLWESLKQMFDHDRSASRGIMTPRGLYVFKHESLLGNASAHVLFDLITIKKKQEVAVVREFSHYEVLINRNELPKGVSLQEML